MNNWKAISDHYKAVNPAILSYQKNEWAIDPYAWDKGIIFLTAIESWLWADLRDVGAVVYPQYPIGRMFVDFANPVAKVAIECDGYAYHLDKAKDAERDRKLSAMGWTVYRISGRNCRTDFDYESRKEGYAKQFVRRICMSRGICRVTHRRTA